MIFKISFRNTFRNPRRTALTIAAVSIAVCMLLVGNSYLQGAFNGIVEDSVRISGHLKLQNIDYPLKERMLSLTAPVEDVNSIIDSVKGVKSVESAAARVKFGGLLSPIIPNRPEAEDISEFGLGIAIDPVREKEILKLHQKVVDGRYFSDVSEASKEAILGAKLAEQLNLKLKDEFTVIAKTAYGSIGAVNLKVVGISGFDNPRLDQAYYLPLRAAQKLLDMENRATEIVIKLENRRLTKATTQKLTDLPQIRGRYLAISWDEATGLKEFLPVFKVVLGTLAMLLILSASLGIINTMSMAVFERIKEIGVMQAFGFKSHQILSVFLIEAMVIGAVGGAIGLLIGSGFGYFLELKGVSLGEAAKKFPIPVKSRIYADLTLMILVRSYAIGLITAALATLLPAFKAAKLHPTEALRKN